MNKAATMDEAEYHKRASDGCFVCHIVAGDPPFPGIKIVYEDDSYIAFLNQFPTQEGYTIVCPKRHVERFETDMTPQEWANLQIKVQEIATAVSKATSAVRMYIGSWGRPDRNSHVHIHVCPCPPGLPTEKQELTAMTKVDGKYLQVEDSRMEELAASIKQQLPFN